MMFSKDNRFIPLCFLSDGNLLCYKKGKIFVKNLSDNRCLSSFRIIDSYVERYLSSSKLIVRFFRLGVRTSIRLSDSEFLLVLKNKIYELDLLNKKKSIGILNINKSRPLRFSHIESVLGFDDMIVYGDYWGNKEKKPCYIYRRVEGSRWDIVYSFANEEIEHIHNIVPDRQNNCVWILTGDFGSSAGIWIAKNNFKDVECLFRGEQTYRSCIAFATNGGLLYATDTPFSENGIYFLEKVNDSWVNTKVQAISGSCIYGCMVKDQFIFSTAVEPDGRKSSIFKLLLSTKRGNGILDKNSYIYMGNLEDGFMPIYKNEKDLFSFIFQFGTIQFPQGYNTTDFLPIYQVALKKGDLCTKIINV